MTYVLNALYELAKHFCFLIYKIYVTNCVGSKPSTQINSLAQKKKKKNRNVHKCSLTTNIVNQLKHVWCLRLLFNFVLEL